MLDAGCGYGGTILDLLDYYKNCNNLINFIKSICSTDNYYIESNKYLIITDITNNNII